MGVFKKIIIALVVLVIIAVGNICISGNLGFSSGSGFLGLIVAAVVVYVFFKLMLKAVGCLPSLLILLGIIFFTLYTIGAFKGGSKEVIPNIKNFLEAKDAPQEEGIILFDEEPSEEPSKELHIGENFEDIKMEQNTETQENQQQEENKESALNKLINNIGNNKKANTPPVNKYPTIYGSAKVLTADTLLIRNHVIRLYGIAAPVHTQTCADNKGHAYACGKKAARWLQNWILDGEIECRILQKTKKQRIATCSYGVYDLGAALVISGWAIALPQNEVYIPYEMEAQKNHSGMWSGKFYKPWDWEKIQNLKPKIKIIKPKSNKKRLWDYL